MQQQGLLGCCRLLLRPQGTAAAVQELLYVEA
jgi:hypothetical protein